MSAERPSPNPFTTPFFLGHPERSTIDTLDHRGAPRTYTFPTFFAHSPATSLEDEAWQGPPSTLILGR